VSIGENIGFEQNGKNDMFERPVLVLQNFEHKHLLEYHLQVLKKMAYFITHLILRRKRQRQYCHKYDFLIQRELSEE
jgi:hypothetical protein